MKLPPADAVAPGDVRLIVVNESFVHTHTLPNRGSAVIGRAPDAEVFVQHPSVSRRHVVLQLGPTITIEDLGSANGTTVNNVALAPKTPVAVRPSDAIRVGTVLVAIQVGGEAPPEALADGTALMRKPDENSTALRDFELDGERVIVRTDAMEKVFALAARVSQTRMTVLILGETGTGKEIVAHTIHARSNRRKAPFLLLNCAALSDTLLESELFGHEKGAFTGAHEAKAGLFEKAAGGTVFLDEVGDTSLQIQAKLLRVFEERRVLRVGSVTPRSIDVRFITATNKDLNGEVAQGKFRKDFLFRLSGVTVHVPPLRERRAEIEPLARLFAARIAAELGRAVPDLAPDTLARLAAHPWPGNIRELKNVVEHAVLVCDDGPVRPDHLQLSAETPAEPAGGAAAPGAEALQDQVAGLERARILDALERSGGNQTKAAELLGMPRRTFVRKLGQYDIERPRKKPT